MSGSKTAKNGFRNERIVAEMLQSGSSDAKEMLSFMGISGSVTAEVVHGEKSDIVVKNGSQANVGVQVKKVSNPKGFNQIDKRWVDKYAEMWSIPAQVVQTLKLFTGEVKTEGKKRLTLKEVTDIQRESLVRWFDIFFRDVVRTLIAGNGENPPKFYAVTDHNNKTHLFDIKDVIAFYTGDRKVEVTNRGSLRIGRIKMQRKGGDNGRPTANMLQFKLDPMEIVRDSIE